MDAERLAREEEKRRLLKRLAELEIEEMAKKGTFRETPHFGRIERAAREVGQDVSREIQERASREVAAECDAESHCPTCGARCDVKTRRRTIESVDGPVELTESVADCKKCRRSFFPSADGDGAR